MLDKSKVNKNSFIVDYSLIRAIIEDTTVKDYIYSHTEFSDLDFKSQIRIAAELLSMIFGTDVVDIANYYDVFYAYNVVYKTREFINKCNELNLKYLLTSRSILIINSYNGEFSMNIM
jgi:hypothetical protein